MIIDNNKINHVVDQLKTISEMFNDNGDITILDRFMLMDGAGEFDEFCNTVSDVMNEAAIVIGILTAIQSSKNAKKVIS